jgi:hypothetical protein
MLIPILKAICESNTSRLLHVEWIEGPLPDKPVYAPSQRYFLRLCRAAHGDMDVPMMQKDVVTLFQVLCAFDRLSVEAMLRLKTWIKELCMSEDLLLRRIMQFPAAFECFFHRQDQISEKLRIFMLDPRPESWDPELLVQGWYASGADDHCLALAQGVQRDIALGRCLQSAYRKHEALEILIRRIKAVGTTSRREALAMGLHGRLGAHSPMNELPVDVLALVVKMAEPATMLRWVDVFKEIC